MEVTDIQFPLETTYEALARHYRSTLLNIFRTDQGTEDETIRCVFSERWLGRQFIKERAGKVIDLNNLIGKKADITVLHINNPGYSKPFCNLAGAYPPGTLTLTEGFAERGGGI